MLSLEVFLVPPIRVGIVDDNVEFNNLIEDFLNSQAEINVLFQAYNGTEAIDLLTKNVVDVLLLDMIMPQLDGFGVLEWLRSQNNKPKVIVFSAFAQEEVSYQATSLGADYYILKPFDLKVLAQRIIDMGRQPAREIVASKPCSDIENEVCQILEKLKIPTHYKGYSYLRDALIMTIKEPSLINDVTKKLYPLIAANYQTTAHRVERSMRFAIENVWNKGDVELLHKLFGYCVDARKGKPTNASFVAIIADKIRLEKKIALN